MRRVKAEGQLRGEEKQRERGEENKSKCAIVL